MEEEVFSFLKLNNLYTDLILNKIILIYKYKSNQTK